MDNESVVAQVQRKIELQSPEDLTYLIANVRAAAAERLNEAFPHVEGNDGEDELRNKIEELVNEVRHRPLLSSSMRSTMSMWMKTNDCIVHRQNLHPRIPKPLHQRPPHNIHILPSHLHRAARPRLRTLRHAQAPTRRRPDHAGRETPRRCRGLETVSTGDCGCSTGGAAEERAEAR